MIISAHLDYVLNCVQTSNVKLARKKCNLFCSIFTYLGHEFVPGENVTRVPDKKRIFFTNFCTPRSQAETLSRLGSIKYYESFFPLLNGINLPIQRMAHGTDGFYWNNTLELCWQSIKLIAELQMANTTIDKDKTLYLACDASQIAVAYIFF